MDGKWCYFKKFDCFPNIQHSQANLELIKQDLEVSTLSRLQVICTSVLGAFVPPATLVALENGSHLPNLLNKQTTKNLEHGAAWEADSWPTIQHDPWPFTEPDCRISYSQHSATGPNMHYATNRKVASSFPDVMGFFNWPDPASRTIALGSTQPLTEMSTRNLSGGQGGRCVELTTSPPFVSQISRGKCENLDVSRQFGPPWPVTGIALPLLVPISSELKPVCMCVCACLSGFEAHFSVVSSFTFLAEIRYQFLTLTVRAAWPSTLNALDLTIPTISGEE
jgi:hypothetical protein